MSIRTLKKLERGRIGRMPMYVKGFEVTTNKNVERVEDSKILFKDGSWCDVITGEVRNLGEGYIKIVPIPKETTV